MFSHHRSSPWHYILINQHTISVVLPKQSLSSPRKLFTFITKKKYLQDPQKASQQCFTWFCRQNPCTQGTLVNHWTTINEFADRENIPQSRPFQAYLNLPRQGLYSSLVNPHNELSTVSDQVVWNRIPQRDFINLYLNTCMLFIRTVSFILVIAAPVCYACV